MSFDCRYLLLCDWMRINFFFWIVFYITCGWSKSTKLLILKLHSVFSQASQFHFLLKQTTLNLKRQNFVIFMRHINSSIEFLSLESILALSLNGIKAFSFKNKEFYLLPDFMMYVIIILSSRKNLWCPS